MNLSDKVKARLRELPDKPGVYMMRDREGRVIYVGKALSLRKRVQSYFRRGTLKSADPKLRGLVRSIDSFDVLVVRSEAEALLTESRFIKEYRPHYNVLLRDDKRFLLLRIKLSDPFPRFTLCRIRKDDDASYFGPYVTAGAARTAKEFVEKRFGLRVCRPRRPGPEDHKHCLNDIIRHCAAPCVGRATGEQYRARVLDACAFMRGAKPEVLKEIEDAMQKASEKMEFERAAGLRDTLMLIRKAVKERSLGTRSFENRAEEALHGLEELKDALRLAAPPRVIECYDISNISGTLAVASMVCAVDGLPRRNRYRHFRIKTVEGSDDPGMMAEVIHRRFKRLLDEGGQLPDLVLVDGGITQLRAAGEQLEALSLGELPLAGLAKRFEELHTGQRGLPSPVRLPLDSAGLHVLQRIRDEAHRFAITYHRKLRSKRIRESVLDEIPGLGKKRKEQLLAHFGSVARLRKASVDDIAAVPGFGKVSAASIVEALRHTG